MAFTFKVDASLGTGVSVYIIGTATIDWGDGSLPQTFSNSSANHVYPTSNVYVATLTSLTGINFYNNNIIEFTSISVNTISIIQNYASGLTGMTISNCINLNNLSIYNTNNFLNLDVDWNTLPNLFNVTFSQGLNVETVEIDNSNVQGLSLFGSFKHLILTGCTNLRNLNTFNNYNLTDIDVSTCSLISSLNVNACVNLSGCTFPNPWSPTQNGNFQIESTGLKNILLENLYSSGYYMYFYIQYNSNLENLTISNSQLWQLSCNYNPNLKTVNFDTINSNGLYFQNNNSLESIVGNTNGDNNTYVSIYGNTVLTSVNILNYSNTFIQISYNNQLSSLEIPNNNISNYDLQNNSLNSYNLINFSTAQYISLQGNNFNSSTFTSFMEAAYLSGAVNVFLNIQSQDTLFTPEQNALSFINLLTNTRGWTILYSILPYPTYAGQLDTTFNEGNYGPDDMVFIIKKQTDGKILIGGRFEYYNDETAGYIKRLNSDGSIDNTFFSGYSFNNVVQAIELQGNKILVGGTFTSYDPQDGNVNVRYIARLNSDGTLDTTFPTGNTFDNQVRVITLQPDGKILVGGNFSTYNDGTGPVISRGLIRLNPDGTVDTSFTVGSGFVTTESGNVYSIIVQDDGKIVVGGWFTTYDGDTANRIVRLNPDGSNDFTMGDPGFNGRVSRIIQQPDGKFLCVGFFTEYSGNSYNRIIRFNPDGNVDTTFQDNNLDWDYIQAIEILDTGKILIGGSSDSGYVNFSMLNSDGTVSDDLTILGGFDSQVNYILQQDHNKVLVGGWFENYQGIPVNYLARLWLYDQFNIPISAGTEVFICYENCSGGTVTTSVIHPYWTNLYGQAVIQEDAIALGGNNGYYN